jgi:opacity protein-like surface antigen
MKKLAILVGAVLLSGATFAQKATLDNPFSLEGVLNYSAGTGIDWQAPTIRARYFVNENIAARVQLGLGDNLGTPMSETQNFYENADGTGNTGSLEIKRMNWVAQVGGEYHLDGTDRMSPYFALGINFGGGSQKSTLTESDGTSYVQGLTGTGEGKMSMFGVGLGAGMDFYVVENIYLGVELGLNFGSYNYSDVTQTSSFTSGGTTVTNTSVTAGSKETHLNTGAGNAAFRLGWRF